MSTGWIVLGVIVVLVLFAFAAYNRLVALIAIAYFFPGATISGFSAFGAPPRIVARLAALTTLARLTPVGR